MAKRRIAAAAFLVPLFALWVPGLLLAWNAVVGTHRPRWVLDAPYDLVGVTNEAVDPGVSFASVSSGDFQRYLGRTVATRLPFYSPAVRARNEIDYSLFHRSPNPVIAIGRHGYLHNLDFMREYCARN